ncbi:MAG TPA: MFS transporter [Candidatus Sulfotelmatobacter sp.]|nr:MFS transporter [Candidatus Sulfotelmatobacter sp.]
MNESAKRYSSYAWVVVALLWPVVLLNYLDRQMVSTIRASIRADIPSIASDEQFGTLMAVFMWVYAFLSPVGGYIADRFNRRWTVIGSLFCWSAVTWATGHAQTYSQMLTLRGLMGVSEAFYYPAALALIADFHTGSTRAKAVGIHQTGLYTGLALGGIGGYIADHSSWRNCFYWFGVVGVIYAVILMFALKDTGQKSQNSSTTKTPVSIGSTISALWSQPQFWILVAYFTLPAIAGWAIKNWLPTYLGDAFQMKQGPAGLSATVYVQFASLIGVVLGGVIADRWMRRTNRGRIFTSATGVMLIVPALLALGYAPGIGTAIGAMILFGLGWGFFDCNSMPILCQIARPEHRATGYGFMNLAASGISGVTTIVFGRMRDQHINFSVAFTVLAGVALCAAVLILTVKPRAANTEEFSK